LAILQLFLDICLFRRGPQDLPASTLFLGLVLGSNALVGLVILAMESSLDRAILELLTGMAMLVVFSWIVLSAASKGERMKQTVTALLGADTVISCMALLPLVGVSASQNVGLASFLLVGLMLWSVTVVAHIYRHALSSSYIYALALTILYFSLSFQVMAYFFPVPR
jgi:hypothetical protein